MRQLRSVIDEEAKYNNRVIQVLGMNEDSILPKDKYIQILELIATGKIKVRVSNVCESMFFEPSTQDIQLNKEYFSSPHDGLIMNVCPIACGKIIIITPSEYNQAYVVITDSDCYKADLRFVVDLLGSACDEVYGLSCHIVEHTIPTTLRLGKLMVSINHSDLQINSARVRSGIDELDHVMHGNIHTRIEPHTSQSISNTGDTGSYANTGGFQSYEPFGVSHETPMSYGSMSNEDFIDLI